MCGATYSPTEVKNPKCSLCGTPPVLKKSDHVFFKLNDFKSFLNEWVPKHTSSEISRKLNEWLKDELREWDISRDEPYFGFKIPGYDDKYFYVWVDAPIGYVSTAKEFFKNDPAKFERFTNVLKVPSLHPVKTSMYFPACSGGDAEGHGYHAGGVFVTAFSCQR